MSWIALLVYENLFKQTLEDLQLFQLNVEGFYLATVASPIDSNATLYEL